MTTLERPTASWRSPALLAGVAVALTAAACLVGALDWPLPTRTTSGWQVADVAPSLLGMVIAVGVVSLVIAAVLVRPRTLGSPAVAATWWVMVVASVLAQTWNDLYFAALAGTGGIIPIFDWLFTFVPALVVGLVARRHGRGVHLRATIGTGLVTLPMLGLGWALASQADTPAATLAGGLYTATVFGALPLVVAVLITRARR
ncbi:class-II aminoacyl-tRNA synthetase family protein [Modestobacter lapidis]|nr:hypothetical protein [Modestobacter lapidis]